MRKPCETVSEPIQAIREKHDRQFRRWMPHLNLLYPFRPQEEFPALTSALVPRLQEHQGEAPGELAADHVHC